MTDDDQQLADDIAEKQQAEALTPIELPCLVATLLPDGNLDIHLQGQIPVDKMFTIAALATRIANKALDDENDVAETRRKLVVVGDHLGKNGSVRGRN